MKSEAVDDVDEAAPVDLLQTEDPPRIRLDDYDEMLFRQQHPDLVRDGIPMSSVFEPKKADAGLLSVSRGARTTAEDAFVLHTKVKGLRSAAVYGVTVGECAELDLPGYEDPKVNPVPDPAHALVDFCALPRKRKERASKKLRDWALERKPLYVAPA